MPVLQFLFCFLVFCHFVSVSQDPLRGNTSLYVGLYHIKSSKMFKKDKIYRFVADTFLNNDSNNSCCARESPKCAAA